MVKLGYNVVEGFFLITKQTHLLSTFILHSILTLLGSSHQKPA